jgi:hypothetical protein
MIIGGIAVVARGVPRLTRDIDAVVPGEGTDLVALLETLGRQAIRPRVPDALAFARESQVLLLRHESSGVDLDLSLAWLPFEHEALTLAESMTLHRAKVRVARAEDLVVYKALAWRPQDQQDVERLLALHGTEMDLERIRRLVGQLCDAIDEPDRVRDLEALVTRTRAGPRSAPGPRVRRSTRPKPGTPRGSRQ